MAGPDRPASRPGWRRFLASPAPFLVALGALFVLQPQHDPDYWWHLLVGRWIVDHGAVPRTELLSWLSGGGSWSAPSWGSEVVLWALHGATGVAGSIALFFAVSLAILAMVAAIAHHVRPSLGPGWLAGLALGAAVVATPIWGPRSQLWDVLFALVAAYGMLRYLDRGDIRWLVAMPIVMVAWANLHGAGALVYLLVALAVVVGEWWNRRAWRRDGRRWRPLLLSILATTLAMAVNPYGPGLYVYGFTTTASGATADFVLEWLSPDFHRMTLRPAQALIAGGLVGLMAFVRVRDARLVAVVAGFTFMFLQSARYVEFLAPFAFGLLGPAMIAALGRLVGPLGPGRLRFHEGHRRLVGIVGIVLGVALLLGRVASLPALQREAVDRAQPVAAADWLAANPQQGRLFSDYGWGGYLAWRLGTQVGPYGASDAFGDVTMAQLADVFGGRTDAAAYLARQQVSTVVVAPASPLGTYLAVAPGWHELFRDEDAVIYGREAAS